MLARWMFSEADAVIAARQALASIQGSEKRAGG